jgi:hypothetical protein
VNADFGPDHEPSPRRWGIPWMGVADVPLTVEPLFPNKRSSVRVAGREVGSLDRPTAGQPWSELVLGQVDPQITLVQIAYPRRRLYGFVPDLPYRTLVFVDGRALDDGRTYTEWRNAAPEPRNQFQRMWVDNDLFTPAGAILMGVIVASPAIIATAVAADASGLLLSLVEFCTAAGWVLLSRRLIRLLEHRGDLSSALRTVAVIAFVLGVPVAFILTGVALTNR